jgi:hypothetical protein
MDVKLIEYLMVQVKLFFDSVDQKEKDTIRNDMFVKMSPFIDRWIKGNLSYRQVYLDNTERLSLCWDCFEFCLKYYRLEKNIPLANHFYGYTRFFFLSWINDKRKIENQDGPSIPPDEGKLDNLNIFYEQIDDLKQFRNAIPESYKSIFDDALLSMTGKTADKIPYLKSDHYSYYKYCESKKVFKIVIDFLLRR